MEIHPLPSTLWLLHFPTRTLFAQHASHHARWWRWLKPFLLKTPLLTRVWSFLFAFRLFCDSRAMPRGWRQHDELSEAFWRRMLMGPRPPSVQWPPAKKGNGKGKGQSADVRPLQNQNRVAPPHSRRWRGHTEAPEQNRVNAEVRRNPNNVEADCAELIRKLEQSRFWAETVHNQQA